MRKEARYRFSTKFYMGIVLVIFSLLVGKITTIILFIYFNDPFLRWTSAIVYVLTWPPFILGVWWIGKEYSTAIQKYFSYRYYHQRIKRGTKKALSRTREKTLALHQKVKDDWQRRKEAKQRGRR